MREKAIIAGVTLVLAGCQALTAPNSGADRARVTPSPDDVRYTAVRYSRPTAILDEDADGTLIGPLTIPDDGREIREVVLEIDISHSYGGDLRAWLHYDVDRDGVQDADTPVELYLARSGCLTSPPMWSHPVTMDGLYFFGHESDVEALDGWDAGTFTVFRGLCRGGSFFLRIADGGDGGVGTLRSWAVHVR